MKKIVITQGKRKQAVARAVLSTGRGTVIVNGQLLENYDNKLLQLRIAEPLVLAGDVVKGLNVSVSVNGGGASGQADATRLAIARALVDYDQSLKKVFYDYDRLLLVADVRQNESCKPNDSKPRAKRQKSYR